MSKLEARRWQDLCLLQRAKEITDLERQVTYRLDVHGVHIANYIADFVYLNKNGKLIVEDTKSPATCTPVYKLKKRLMLAVHGIDIVEVYKADSRLSSKVIGKRKIPSRRFGT